MFTFRDNTDLHNAIRAFYEAEKPVAAFCHGVAALVDATLSDGSYLVTGKTVTGFANVEEIIASSCKHTRMCSIMFVCIHQHNLRSRSESQ
jgi:putative intracellular protease/amidase